MPDPPADRRTNPLASVSSVCWQRGVSAVQHDLAPSSSGPGHRPLKAATAVQIRSGLQVLEQVTGLAADYSDQALIICHWFVIEFCRPWANSDDIGWHQPVRR